MIYFSNKKRSEQSEIMDSMDFQGKEMERLLNDLKTVNKWLGGNRITVKGMDYLLRNHPKDRKLTILDIGCGDGELLRKCADYGKRNNFHFECIGIDFNSNILEYAKTQSKNNANIEFRKVDVFFEENLI